MGSDVSCMQHSLLSGSLLTMLALVMAGCTGTGNFDVQQTEPFRVSLEGEPQTVVVSDDDSEAKEVVIDTCDDPCDAADAPEQVNVKVEVKPTSAEACRIMVIVKDRDSGEVLDQVEIDGDGTTATTTTTSSGNATGNATTTTTAGGDTDASGDTNVIVQNIVVNVKGKDNIVVLTQAIEGSADVDISAASATGNADADASIDGDAWTSSSDTMTATSSTTTTASSTNTTTGP
jgi:hypothetical protein